MSFTKEASVAGLFYPSDPVELSESIDLFLASSTDLKNKKPLAIIAPHAGHRYSGALATKAISSLKNYSAEIKKVAILAPAHTLPLQGMALSSADHFATPLGAIEVDQSAGQEILKHHFINTNDMAFNNEHAVEVQLPILQKIMPDLKILPIIVGDCQANSVEQVIDELIKKNFLILISTDLSHFLPYLEAKKVDQKTAELITKKRWSELNPHHACGHFALSGMLKWCKDHHKKINQIDVINSADTAGDRMKVVGYGAWYITEEN